MKNTSRIYCLLVVCTFLRIAANGQHPRSQYPFFLSDHTYFEASLSYIDYHFTTILLEPGYQAESVEIPHAGVRLLLYGYRFSKNFSCQVNYMRPIFWVHFVNINGDHVKHSMPTNVAGLTFKARTAVAKRLSIYGEAGLGIITRAGITFDDIPVTKNANFSTILYSGGVEWTVSRKFSFDLGVGSSPGKKKFNQPATNFVSAGFVYNVHRLPEETVARNENSGYIFPKNLLQVGYSSNFIGYGVNNFFANKVFPIFWGGDAEVKQGVSVQYQHNIFHGRKLFSLDGGASIAYWQSKKQRQNFFTFSLFPVLRFSAFHFKTADLYFDYSVAGPAYISKTVIDHNKTGEKFTFQDFLGTGVYLGKKRTMNAEIRILHYSNGDLFPENTGVMIPLTFNLGFSF